MTSKRDQLAALLLECSPDQVGRFHQFFPETITDKQLTSAIDLCQRTIVQNQKTGRYRPPSAVPSQPIDL